MMDRKSALELLHKYTKTSSLRKHALAVEAAMRDYAVYYGEDVEKWGVTGILHDFDYEKYPNSDEHPYKGNEILKEVGVSEDIRTAIMGHADYTGVKRETLMAKTLFAVDELSGFIMAVALVRPSKSIFDLKPKSVKKKFKAKAFSKNVSREDINLGIQELGVDETEHIQHIIDSLKTIAKELELEGEI